MPVRSIAALSLLAVCSAGCTMVRTEPPVPAKPQAKATIASPPPVMVAPPPPAPADLAPDTSEPPPEKGQPVEPPSDLEIALKYSDLLRGLTGNDLRREHEIARQAYAQTPNELNRVRYALVASHALNPVRDERRALESLEPFAKAVRADYTPLRAFALVLYSFLREQVKLGSNAQALKEKLDALMSIEKSLAGRDRAPAGGRR